MQQVRDAQPSRLRASVARSLTRSRFPPMSQVTFSAEDLQRFASAAYNALGLPEADARLVAESLVHADLWGHQSHGVMRTFWYGARIQSGAAQPVTTPVTVVDGGAIAVIDGHNGMGQVVAQEAMRQAITRARQHGVGVVPVRNSGHFGTTMFFTRQAAQAGCIGFLTTNASPAMAPWGGREKRVGNNPWSIAAPAGRYAPMMLDIANTAVARGKLYLARQKGEAIPLGWAIDEHGVPTTDPVAGIAGNILPMGGHKGYAVATLMDVLSGVLSGSRFGDAVVGPYMQEGTSGVGHLAMALNIAAFRPLQAFNEDMERMIAKLKDTPRAPGTEAIAYPGEPEALAEQRQRQTGIALPEDTVAELDAAARALGLEGLRSRP